MSKHEEECPSVPFVVDDPRDPRLVFADAVGKIMGNNKSEEDSAKLFPANIGVKAGRYIHQFDDTTVIFCSGFTVLIEQGDVKSAERGYQGEAKVTIVPTVSATGMDVGHGFFNDGETKNTILLEAGTIQVDVHVRQPSDLSK